MAKMVRSVVEVADLGIVCSTQRNVEQEEVGDPVSRRAECQSYLAELNVHGGIAAETDILYSRGNTDERR
jgi:hypothetical protein